MRNLIPHIDLPAILLLTTPVMFLIFIGIVAWSMQRNRNKTYDAASKLPLSDD